MTKAFKKVTAALLSAGLLSTAVAVTLPWATADSTIPSPRSWQYSMVQDFNSLTNSNDGGTDRDYWQASDNYHKVQWKIADAKGVDSTNALYVHTTLGDADNGTSELSINRTNSGIAGACSTLEFNAVDVTSPTELWMWVDFTGTTKPERFRITPSFTVDGNTVAGAPIEGAPVYFQTADGWKASTFIKYTDGSTYPDLNNVFVNDADLVGFKGYIRIPMASLNSTVDWANAHITAISSGSTGLQTAFYYSYDASGNLIDDGFYMDNMMVVGTTAAGGAKLSDLLPKPNANLKYAMVQDFNTLTNSNDGNTDRDYWQASSNYHKVQWKIADAKGTDASNALYVHTTLGDADNKTSELSINRTNSGIAGACSALEFSSIDVTSPSELWMWVDFTGTTKPERFRITPSFTVDGNTVSCAPIEGAPVYFQDTDSWKASAFKKYTDGNDTYPDLNNVFFDDADLVGFKGYIRIPLSSMDATVDWTKAHITAISSGSTGLQTAFYYSYDASGNLIDDGFYMDNLMVVGTSAVNGGEVSALNVPEVTSSVAEVPDSTDWNMFNIEDYETTALGTSYANWGNYCKSVTDTAVADLGFKGSQALYVHSTAASVEGAKYSQPFYYTAKSMTVTGADELWYWVDYSNYTSDSNLTIRPRIRVASKGDTNVDLKLKSDAPVYYQSDSGLKKVSKTLKLADPAGESSLAGADIKGFKGFIRIPLSSFTPDTTIDLTTDTITQYFGAYFIFDFSFLTDANDNYAETGYYLDNVLFAGSALTGGEPLANMYKDKAPDASTWKVSMADDMEGMTAGTAYGNWGNYCKNVVDAATAGVGFLGSQGLYVHSTAASADSGYSQPWYYINKTGDFSGAKELWIWYDFSKYDNPSAMEIRPRITAEGVDGNIDLNATKDAPIYLQSETGTVVTHFTADSKVSGTDLAGFKGFIRMPLTSFTPDKTVDLKTAKITALLGMYNVFGFQFKTDASEQYVETGYVMDNIALVGPTVNGTLTVAEMLNPTPPTTDTSATDTTATTATETTATETTATTASETSVSTDTTATGTTTTKASDTTSATTTAKSATTTAKATTATTTTKSNNPATGENSPLAVCALAVLAAASGTIMLLKKKK